MLTLMLCPMIAMAGESLSFETSSVFPLAKGIANPVIERIQSRLHDLGFTNALPDGIYGAQTISNIKWLQRVLNNIDGYSFTVDGAMDEKLYRVLMQDVFPVGKNSLTSGSSGDEVTRLQRRLLQLGYLTRVTGTFGTMTKDAISQFQTRNGIEANGIANQTTREALYSSTAKAQVTQDVVHPRIAYVDIAKQRVYVYRFDGTGYNTLERTMLCSTGTKGRDTITGMYHTTEHCGEWYWFGQYSVWAKYAIRIRGPYLFHSTLYNSRNDNSPRTSTIRQLGSRASHGCIRLPVEDIKWLYENTQTGFTTIIY